MLSMKPPSDDLEPINLPRSSGDVGPEPSNAAGHLL